MFKELFERNVYGGPDGSVIVGIVALPLAIAFGIASGVSPEKGIITAIIAGYHHLSAGRKQSPDRRTDRSFHCDHLRHHPAIWRSRTDCGNAYGRCSPYIIRSVQARSRYQVYSVSHYRRFHQRYCRYHFYYADCRYLRPVLSEVKKYREILSEMDDLFPSFRYRELVEYHCKYCQHHIIAITPRFSKKIPGSLIAIIVVTVAVYLMKTYGGIDCIPTIGDRFTIKSELPDAVVPASGLGSYQKSVSRSYHYCSAGSYRITLVCHR